MKTAAVHARTEPEIKREAEDLPRMGLGGLPFPVEIPNKQTLETLARSRRGEDIEEFDSLERMFESWEK